jgi:hypothetical protein
MSPPLLEVGGYWHGIAYNEGVEKPVMPNPSGRPEPARSGISAERRRALRAEAFGILLIALAILLFTILRHGAHINWSAR